MSNCVALHSQLVSIMEVLANAAVAEICKLIDEGYAVLRSEMSRSQKENEALKRKLSMQTMELRIAKEGHFPSAERAFCNQADPWRDGEQTAVEEEDTAVHSARREQSTEMDKGRPQSLLIKKEGLEEDLENSHPQIGLKIAEEEDDVGKRAPVVDTQTAPAVDAEEHPEHHGTVHNVWEDCGLDTVLKSEPENDGVNQRLQDPGSELGADRLNNLSYEYVTYERSSQQQPFFTQAINATEDPPCSYGSVPESEGLSVDSDLQPVEKRVNISSVRSPEMKPEAVIIESVPNKLENEITSGTLPRKHRHYKEHREKEALQTENVTDVHSSHSQMTVKENIVFSKSSAQDMIEYPLYDGFPSSRNDRTFHKARTREKRFICTFCGKSFTCPKNLETHQRVHTGEKPFSCNQCGKRFSDSSNRKRHQIIHTGERPYSCTLCGKRFTQSSCLIAHQRVHTGEKPFSCTQCGKRFADSSNLKRHQSVHIGKKQLSCTLWEEFNCFQTS